MSAGCESSGQLAESSMCDTHRQIMEQCRIDRLQAEIERLRDGMEGILVRHKGHDEGGVHCDAYRELAALFKSPLGYKSDGGEDTIGKCDANCLPREGSLPESHSDACKIRNLKTEVERLRKTNCDLSKIITAQSRHHSQEQDSRLKGWAESVQQIENLKAEVERLKLETARADATIAYFEAHLHDVIRGARNKRQQLNPDLPTSAAKETR